jgi:hypothetical protein
MASAIVPFAGGQTGIFTPEDQSRAIAELSSALEDMSRRIQVLENMLFTIRHTVPDKPRAPMIVYADGVHWDPGPAGGEGYYELLSNGTWHKL